LTIFFYFPKIFFIFVEFFRVYRVLDRVCMSFSSRVGSDLKRVGLNACFFETFLSAPVLNSSVLIDMDFYELYYGAGQVESQKRVQRIRSKPVGLFYNTRCEYVTLFKKKEKLVMHWAPAVWH
jgi:hypothetical protein